MYRQVISSDLHLMFAKHVKNSQHHMLHNYVHKSVLILKVEHYKNGTNKLS
jgi:hypothetical protein